MYFLSIHHDHIGIHMYRLWVQYLDDLLVYNDPVLVH